MGKTSQEAPEILDPTELEMDQEDIFSTFKQEFGKDPNDSTMVCKVWRIPEGKSNQKGIKEEWICDVDQSEFDGLATRLREWPGTGTYRIRLFQNKQQIRGFDFHILAPPKPIANGNSQFDPASLMQSFERALASNNERMAAMIERFQPPAQVQSKPFDWQAFIPLMATVIPTLREVLMPKTDTTLIEVFKAGIEVAKGATGSDSGDTNAMDLIKSAIESGLVGQITAGAQQRALANPSPPPQPSAQQIPPRRTAPGNVPPPRQAPHIQATVPAEQQETFNQVRETLLLLVKKAQRNLNPELYAEFVADEWNENDILAMLELPDAFGALAQVAPEIVPYRAWFDQVLAALKNLFYSDEDAEPDNRFANGNPNGGGGDTRNAQDHADADTGGKTQSERAGDGTPNSQ